MTVTDYTIEPGDFYRMGWNLKEIIAVQRHEGHSGVGRRVAYINKWDNLASIGAATIWERDENNSIVRKVDVDAEIAAQTVTSVVTIKDAPWLTSIKYGTPEEVGQTYLDAERKYTRSAVRNFLVNDDTAASTLNEHNLAVIVCDVYTPEKGAGSAISVIRTSVDRKRDRRTTMKPGKAFRLMFPDLSDKQVATITEAWIELTSPRELTLYVAKSREAFAEAYGGKRAPYRNPVTTCERKSLATSCMQHIARDMWVDDAFVNTSVGEVYASGDFAIAYLKDKDGLIAGRVVYSDPVDGTCYAGPVYGACEQSLDMLQKHLADVKAPYNVEGWDGLRFNLIGSDDDPLAPYVDGDVGGTPSRCGNYIILEKYGGQYGFDGTEGYVSAALYCECCEEGIHPDNSYMTDDGHYCEVCFDENYAILDCGSTVPREYAVEVFFKGWQGGVNTTLLHIDDAVYCEQLDQYWHPSDITFDEEGDAHPTHLLPSEDENNEEAA